MLSATNHLLLQGWSQDAPDRDPAIHVYFYCILNFGIEVSRYFPVILDHFTNYFTWPHCWDSGALSLFVHNLFCNHPNILEFCTRHCSDTTVFSATFHNDWTTETDVMDERDFRRFEFKMSFGWISYIVHSPLDLRIRLLQNLVHALLLRFAKSFRDYCITVSFVVKLYFFWIPI